MIFLRRPVLSLAALALSLVACGDDPIPVAAEARRCLTTPQHAAIVTALDFTRQTPSGAAPGFDLDGRVSELGDSESCGKKDLVDLEGRPGVDNQLSVLIPEIEAQVGDAVTGLVQGAINNGELILLLELGGAESLRDDECVNLAVQVGEGQVSLGTDGAIEAFQTFSPHQSSPRNFAPAGSIQAGEMSAGPFTLAVPLSLFNVSFTLHLHDARFRFRVDESGALEGIFGGGIEVAEILDGVKDGAGVEELLPFVQLVLESAADLAPDEDGICRRISAALEFKAVPAFVRR